MNSTPASSLKGLKLKNGWEVIDVINPPLGSTGGRFSVGYFVKNENGKEGYLKALDFSSAFQTPDFTTKLEKMTAAYNFERDLLRKCKNNRLKRVVTPIDDGTVTVPGFGMADKVCYLIFKKAKGDIRNEMTRLKSFDLAWCLRSLHHIAIGLEQLHYRGVAHQDLKPSNVLIFERIGSKISDLGRASDKLVSCDHDCFDMPGDTGYAPIEQFYGYQITDEFYRRFSFDMYLLGGLFFFYFLNISVTQAIHAKLKNMNLSNTDFINDLPYIKNAFQEAVNDLKSELEKEAGILTDDIINIVYELCEPDPKRRGHTKNIGNGSQQYSLIRYISKLDLLARRAEAGWR